MMHGGSVCQLQLLRADLAYAGSRKWPSLRCKEHHSKLLRLRSDHWGVSGRSVHHAARAIPRRGAEVGHRARHARGGSAGAAAAYGSSVRRSCAGSDATVGATGGAAAAAAHQMAASCLGGSAAAPPCEHASSRPRRRARPAARAPQRRPHRPPRPAFWGLCGGGNGRLPNGRIAQARFVATSLLVVPLFVLGPTRWLLLPLRVSHRLAVYAAGPSRRGGRSQNERLGVGGRGGTPTSWTSRAGRRSDLAARPSA